MKVVAWNTRGKITPKMRNGLISLTGNDNSEAIKDVDLAILPEFGSRPNILQADRRGVYLRRNEQIARKLNLAVFVSNGILSEEMHDPLHGVISAIWQINKSIIRVVAIHSQLNYVKSVMSLQERLADWSQEHPLIVGGDFNMNAELTAGGNSRTKFGVFWHEFHHYLDSVYHVRRGINPSKSDPATLRTSNNNTMIDYIFVSRAHFTVLDSDVDRSAQQSDHFAVTSELALK